MSLQRKLREDMLAAMLARDPETVSLLRVATGEFGREMNNGIELSDDRVLAILKKMKENAIMLSNLSEVEILNRYLPTMLGENQIKVIVAEIIQLNSFSGVRDIGKVMSEIKKLPTATQIDGKISSRIVKELLG